MLSSLRNPHRILLQIPFNPPLRLIRLTLIAMEKTRWQKQSAQKKFPWSTCLLPILMKGDLWERYNMMRCRRIMKWKKTFPKKVSNEAVHSESNVATQAHRPSTQLDRPVGENNIISWADVVAKNLVAQGDGVGEDVTQLQNRRDTESVSPSALQTSFGHTLPQIPVGRSEENREAMFSPMGCNRHSMTSSTKPIAFRNISRQGRVAVPHIAKKRKQNQQRITCQVVLKKRKGKRYGSLRDFQDRVLTDFEKKRRDRALRRIKKKDIENTSHKSM
ncbi:hypothetical protein GQ457_05G017820 [Hibiscus cannabinus]